MECARFYISALNRARRPIFVVYCVSIQNFLSDLENYSKTMFFRDQRKDDISGLFHQKSGKLYGKYAHFLL